MATKKSIGRASDLTEEQAEHVREAMKAAVAKRYAGHASALADDLHVSAAAVSYVLTRRNRPSRGLAETFATLVGTSLDALLSGQAGEADPYPERAAALARLRGLLPAEVEAHVRAVEAAGRLLTEVEWIELALARLRDHALAARVRSAGKPVK